MKRKNITSASVYYIMIRAYKLCRIRNVDLLPIITVYTIRVTHILWERDDIQNWLTAKLKTHDCIICDIYTHDVFKLLSSSIRHPNRIFRLVTKEEYIRSARNITVIRVFYRRDSVFENQPAKVLWNQNIWYYGIVTRRKLLEIHFVVSK
jgi:hypothetical protein